MSTTHPRTGEPIDPRLEAAFIALAIPRTAWPGTLEQMPERVWKAIASSVLEGRATPDTQRIYREWQIDRRQKGRAAAKPLDSPTPSRQFPRVAPVAGEIHRDWGGAANGPPPAELENVDEPTDLEIDANPETQSPTIAPNGPPAAETASDPLSAPNAAQSTPDASIEST